MSVTDKLHSGDPFKGNETQAPMAAQDADRHAGMARGIAAVGAVWVVAGAIVVAIVLLAASIIRGG